MARARVSAGYEETPRTLNSSAPSSSTGAAGTTSLTASVVPCASTRPKLEAPAASASDTSATRMSDIAVLSVGFQSRRAKHPAHALDDVGWRRVDVVQC